jgi:hypothetical protein
MLGEEGRGVSFAGPRARTGRALQHDATLGIG